MWHRTLDWYRLLELISLSILLTALIILGIWGIVRIRRWSQNDRQTTLSTDEELAAFRNLLEQGSLTQEEFDRVQSRLKEPGRTEASSAPSPNSAPPPALEPHASEPPPGPAGQQGNEKG